MIWILAAFSIALALAGSQLAAWAPVPLGLLVGWSWGGALTAVPFGVLALIAPHSLRRWRLNRAARLHQGDLIRCLEAMLESSYLTSNRDEVLKIGGSLIRQAMAGDPAAPLWLSRSLRQVFCAPRGIDTHLQRALTLMVEEGRDRSHLSSEIQSQNSAMGSFVIVFLAVEAVLGAWVAFHPTEFSLFRSGVGLALGLWVVISTSFTLVLPWLEEGAGLW